MTVGVVEHSHNGLLKEFVESPCLDRGYAGPSPEQTEVKGVFSSANPTEAPRRGALQALLASSSRLQELSAVPIVGGCLFGAAFPIACPEPSACAVLGQEGLCGVVPCLQS